MTFKITCDLQRGEPVQCVTAPQGEHASFAVESGDLAHPLTQSDTFRWYVLEGPHEATEQTINNVVAGSIANYDAELEHLSVHTVKLHTAKLAPKLYTVIAHPIVDVKNLAKLEVEITGASGDSVQARAGVEALDQAVGGIRNVNETFRSGITVDSAKGAKETNDQALWVAIRQCTQLRRFDKYDQFVQGILCDVTDPEGQGCERSDQVSNIEPQPAFLPEGSCLYRHGVHGYQLLKAATEVFLLCETCCDDLSIDKSTFDKQITEERIRLGQRAVQGSDIEARLRDYLQASVSPGTLPYLAEILQHMPGLKIKPDPDKTPNPELFPFCQENFRLQPCLFELIWSYWTEEGMLVQAISAISLRFQNRRVMANGRDPLASFELNPLRPLNNLLWGYIQDEQIRLTVTRRAYEYDHHYGLKLLGKAVGELQSADPRSRFLEAFHSLLHDCAKFYKEDANAWVTPDPFPLLNSIRSAHLLLSEGAHNQWGDLPSTARMEMLIQQWLLTQPPMREFLQSRAMVPYEEPWMGQVDAMKKLMGWTDVSVMHFHKLAVFGEQILLSIRFGNWSDVSTLAEQARNWALYWRPEIQGYIQSYRAVTGVDLTADLTTATSKVDATLPAVHLRNRLAQQLRQTAKRA